MILEEMRRVLAFLAWHVVWWERQGSLRSVDRPEDAEGYLHKQNGKRRFAVVCMRSLQRSGRMLEILLKVWEMTQLLIMVQLLVLLCDFDDMN